MSKGDWRKAWEPDRPHYSDRIRAGEHESRGKAPGARFSAQELEEQSVQLAQVVLDLLGAFDQKGLKASQVVISAARQHEPLTKIAGLPVGWLERYHDAFDVQVIALFGDGAVIGQELYPDGQRGRPFFTKDAVSKPEGVFFFARAIVLEEQPS